MVQSKTLLVRHLPPNLSDEEKVDLMAHFGALRAKVISSKVKKNNLLFATFPTEEEAAAALHRLHQLDVLGYPLTVEFAKGDPGLEALPEVKQTFQDRKEDNESCQKHYEKFLHKLNTWHNTINFTQPPPAHLRYQYPPPSRPVLINIMRALASVPKFYTQVLHLMNKMNLPCPFDITFPEPDILRTSEPTPQEPSETDDILEEEEMMTSTEESEIESDEDTAQSKKDVLPMKRALPQKKTRVKRPKFIKPAVPAAAPSTKPSTKPEEVFEKVDLEPGHRKIALILSSEPSGSNPTITEQEPASSGGFGFISTSTKDANVDQEVSVEVEEKVTQEKSEKTCISSRQLASNRISSRDQKHLAVFKNYQPGIPSCRLYIKNLSKQVETKDLHYIYSKYEIPDYEEQGSMFDIRLMQEGRMKGQAFITLQNVKLAQRALNETNGYILRDKPMVVQFARSAVPKTA